MVKGKIGHPSDNTRLEPLHENGNSDREPGRAVARDGAGTDFGKGLSHRQDGLLEELESAETVGGPRFPGHRIGAERNPGVSRSAGVALRALDGAELGIELRRETCVAHNGASSISTKEKIPPMKQFLKENWLIMIIMVYCFIICFIGAWWGLPYLYHPDEPHTSGTAINMILHRDLNPHMFYYPSFHIYLLTFAFGLFHIIVFFYVLFTTGHLQTILEIKTMLTNSPWIYYFLARIITVFFTVGCVAVIYLIVKRLTNKKIVSAFAGFLFASIPLIVEHSKYGMTDIPFTFWILLSIYFCLKLLERNKSKYYYFACIAGGLAVSSKYFAALVVFPIGLSLLSYSFNSFNFKIIFKNILPFVKHGAIGAMLFIMIFIFTSPFVLLDWHNSSAQIIKNKEHHQTKGHLGGDKLPAIQFYSNNIIENTGYIILVMSALGLIFLKKEGWIVASCPILFIAYISTYKVSFDRYLISLLPLIAISASVLINTVLKFSIDKNNYIKYSIVCLLVVLICIGIIPMVKASIQIDKTFLLPDTRTIAKEWIEANIPSESKIAYEFYCPQLELNKIKNYKLVYSFRLEQKDLTYYLNNSVDYIIVSSSFMDRYMNEQSKYPNEVKFYSDLQNNATLINKISPDKNSTGPVIFIYDLTSYKLKNATMNTRK